MLTLLSPGAHQWDMQVTHAIAPAHYLLPRLSITQWLRKCLRYRVPRMLKVARIVIYRHGHLVNWAAFTCTIWYKVCLCLRKTNLSSSGLENRLERNNHCLKYDYEIQDTLASAKPPFDNFFNISRSIYPTGELSSKLINIWVHFTNSSTNLTQESLQKFMWSRSCLYVSDRYSSLQAMSLYSLGSIWPNRNQESLHIAIPLFCNSEASEKKLVQFLSR